MTTFNDVFNLQMGRTPARNTPEYWNGTHNWMSISDICGKYTPSVTRERITDAALERTGIKVVPKGTVIMSFKLSIGKASITAEDIFTNEAIMAFMNKGIYAIDSEWLYYYLMGQDWSEGTNKAVKGKTLNKATLGQRQIQIPPLLEQREIAGTLAQVDTAIDVCNRILSALDELVKARFVEMFGDIVEGNPHFETVKLRDVATVGSSHRVFTSEFVENGVPFYRGTEIGELAKGIIPRNPFKISEEHYQKLTSDETKTQLGDLLMPSICNKGQVWMVNTDKPFYYKDGRVLSISPNRELLDPVYLLYYMRRKTEIEYPKLGSGSTFAEFKIFLLKDMDVQIPPRDLQTSYSTFVEAADNTKKVIRAILDELNILQASLMQEYFG